MKKTSSLVIALTALSLSQTNIAEAQNLRNVVNAVVTTATNSGNTKGLGNLSNADIVGGLKDALNVGTKNATNKLSLKDGYFTNNLIKIGLPKEAAKVESTLRNLGMGSVADNTIILLNRAAEDAAAKATPIFLNAIKNMTIQDGVNILNGSNDAATNFLKLKTNAALTAAFRPVIEASLNKLNVATTWNQLFTAYNKLPTTFNKINPDLTGYVTERALNGMFVTIAGEEAKIRKDPAARVTELLQKVFGK